MADKISEAQWKAFTRKQKLELDDKALLKVLAALDKTDERKPEPRLEALAELIKEIPRQVAALVKRKKELGDKPFGIAKDELYAILEEAEALQKKTQAALEAENDDDEDSTPSALVNPKLLYKQLSMCRKDPERTMKFAFVDAKGKDQPAMLAMHPRMSARALFAKLQAAAGVKTGAFGTAWVDGMSLMLQLDKPLSGLVKKVRPPVKACGFKITKAVLWNEDGTVFEQDELPEEAVTEDSAPSAATEPLAGEPTAPPQPAVTYETKLAALLPRVKKAADDGSPDATKHQRLLEFAATKAGGKDYLAAVAALKQVEQLLDSPPPRDEAGAAEAGIAFKARLSALLPKLKEARAAGRAGALEATARSTEAGMAAGKRDFGRANELLDEAEGLLASADSGTAPGDAAPPTSSPSPSPSPSPRTISIVKLQQLRLAWDSARKKAQSEIGLLQAEILKKAQGESDYDDILKVVKDFDALKREFDEGLIDKLDEALNAKAEDREPLYAQAVELINAYRQKVASDPLLSDLDNNPFVKITVQAMLTRTLGVLAQQLA